MISFLGKSQKQQGQYREAHYDINGHVLTSRFFGKALKEVIKPDQLIFLGTNGSMWDVLLESMGIEQQQEDDYIHLMEAVDNDCVTQVQLEKFEQLASQFLGLPCLLKLIPYGLNDDEQAQILKKMAEHIQRNDQVTLDLTHGLRHLPMLGLLSAMYLRIARDVDIKGIYYAALDLTPRNETPPKTPVMRLDGLLKLADWITALDGFDKTGDILPFVSLLKNEGVAPETADLLKQAAFFENIMDIPKARKPLKDFDQQTQQGLPRIAALFQDNLHERIAWHEGNDIYQRQRSKAIFYLQRHDYVRAVAMGYEAYVTFHLKQETPALDPENYEHRQDIREKLNGSRKKPYFKDYKKLRNLRNALAHANRSETKEAQRALNDEASLNQELTRLFAVLLKE